MVPPNIDDQVSFGIFITASQGCEHANPILEQVIEYKLATDSLVLLEISEGDCLFTDPAQEGNLPHLRFDSANEFAMRRRAAESNLGTHTLVIEDHMSIDREFLPALRELLAKYKEVPALGFYAVNGTKDNYASRILFRWIFGLAALDLWPRSPEPVCSAFLLNNNFFSVYREELGREIETGEMESHLIPYVVPRVNGILPKALHVMHSQSVSIFQAAQGVYENTRISGHLEKDTNIFVWLIILLQRHYFRFFKILRAKRLSFVESMGVFFLANVGLFGGIVGRFIPIKNSYSRLAKTHPKLQK